MFTVYEPVRVGVKESSGFIALEGDPPQPEEDHEVSESLSLYVASNSVQFSRTS